MFAQIDRLFIDLNFFFVLSGFFLFLRFFDFLLLDIIEKYSRTTLLFPAVLFSVYGFSMLVYSAPTKFHTIDVDDFEIDYE
jgi:hypothetical protein